MKICQLDPHLRFAAGLRYEMPYNKKPVRVTDCRIFYVTQGYAQVTICDATYTLEPDTLFYCCSGSRYTVETQEGFSLVSLNFDLSQQFNNIQRPISPFRDPKKWDTMPVFTDHVTDSSFLNDHLFLTGATIFRDPVLRIAEDFSAIDPLSQLLCCQRLKLLLLELHRASQKELPEKLQTVREYIHDHYAERITNKTLADLVGYHEYYLNRIFLSYTGKNLHSYLLSVRLEHAKELILNTDLSLQVISSRVGFGNYAHFSAYFKQICHQSPAQYRKQLRSNI